MSLTSELHVFQDKTLDFCAVIALQQYGRGPALGGCRMLSYPSIDAAIAEAVRLAHAMSYKAALSDLPHDGGKAVIIQSNKNKNHLAVLKKFAECVHSLGGKYITTIDSGTSQADMSIIKNNTSFVTGYLNNDDADNNPSISTAFGVFKGIQAAVKLIYGRDDLVGLRVAIQGVGNVGYYLANYLYHAGAQLIICDTNLMRAQRCLKEFNATLVEPAAIYAAPCDIFSPCALGQVINPLTLPQLKAKIIAGAANDQLSSAEQAEGLAQRDIFYIPDYLINAGGLIHLSLQEKNKDKSIIAEQVSRIAERIMHLTAMADSQKKTLFAVTEATAEKLLN